MSETSNPTDGYSATDVELLTGLEAVRRRPQMYVGSLDAPALPSELLLETLCHAVDEIVDGTCSTVSVGITGARSGWAAYDAGMSLEPSGSGNGLPAAQIFLAVHLACHNHKKHIAVGHRHCRYGLATLNAFCDELTATTYCAGKRATLSFTRGVMAPYLIEPTECADHTRIDFKLDETLIAGVIDRSLVEIELAALAAEYPRATFLLADGETIPRPA